jgi:hypothetical protein
MGDGCLKGGREVFDDVRAENRLAEPRGPVDRMLVSRRKSSSFSMQAVTWRAGAARSLDSVRYDAGKSDRS